ncbi:MAG: protein kinase domain-containing protein [Cellulomonadaceae bacterium]
MQDEKFLGSSYVLESVIGRGAMGQVWRGRNRQGQVFAFKVLRPELAGDPSVVQRFVQERGILTGLSHPGLVRIHDLVVEGDTLAIVMDLVQGGDLRAMLTQRGPLPPAEVAVIGSHIAAALGYLHRAGIVHRDVKPENILIDVTGGTYHVRVADFGIAKLSDSSALSATTALVGTPQYMAPELADGHGPTPAVDMYALGIILYELSCGVTPYAGAPTLTALRLHADTMPGRPEGVPDPLWHLIERLLGKDPAQRPTADRAAAELAELAARLQGVPPAPRIATPPAPVPAVHTQETRFVDRSATTSATGPASAGAAADAPAERPRTGRGKVVAVSVVAAVLLLGAGGYGASLLLGGSDEPTPQAQTTEAPTPEVSAATTAASVPSEEPTAHEMTPEATVMPQLVGLTLAQAQRELPTGTTVETIEQLDETATGITVTAQSPEEGQPLGESVTLTVVRPPQTVYLERLPELAGGQWSQEVAQLSGEDYPHSLVSYSNRSEGYTAWNLSRGYRTLKATVGMNDLSSAPGSRTQVQVFADQVKVWEDEVAFGEYSPMEIDVTDVLRLEISFKVLDDDGEWNAAWVVLGDIRLLGVPGETPPLDEG